MPLPFNENKEDKITPKPDHGMIKPVDPDLPKAPSITLG